MTAKRYYSMHAMRALTGWSLSVLVGMACLPMPQALAQVPAATQPAAEKISITGRIIDKDKIGMPGVTILEKGTRTGTTTDLEGNFKIRVTSEASVLLVRSIGMKTIERQVGKSRNLVLTMQEEGAENGIKTKEVVVSAFGQKNSKTSEVANITKIGGKELEGVQASSFDAMLQGRAPGLQVTQSSGVAGGAVSIRVRGTGSLSAASEPLYVIDGVPIVSGASGDGGGQLGGQNLGFQLNPMSDINSADIESIEVLKDAAATALYGARGSNGVVLVTTKKGRAGKTKFNLSYNVGFANPTNRVKLLNGPQYLQVLDSAMKNTWYGNATNTITGRNVPNRSGYLTNPILTNGFADTIAKTTDVDYLDQTIRRDARVQELSLSGSGGNERTTFFAGGSYRDEQGVLAGNRFQRLSGRFSIDNTANDILKLGISTALTYSINDLVPTGQSQGQGGFGTAQYRSLPIFPINTPDSIARRGQVALPVSQLYPNPYFNAYGAFAGTNIPLTQDREQVNYRQQVFRNLTNAYVQLRVNDRLTWKNEFGFDFRSQLDNNYLSRLTRVSNVGVQIPTASASDARVTSTNINLNSFLNYGLDIDEDNRLDALGGLTYQRTDITNNSIEGERFPNDYSTNVSSAERTLGAAGNSTFFSFLAAFGQANYKYKGKYIAQFSTRYEGSSRFGPKNRFGVFAGLGLAWIISEEAYFKEVKWLSLLKVRASYGRTGNAAGLDNFQSFGLYQAGATYNLNPGTSPSRLANDNLTWEKNDQLDVSTEWGVFNNRISGSVTYFDRYSRDMLLALRLAPSLGMNDGSVLTNIGELSNTGWEFTLTTQNFTSQDNTGFSWSTDFNITIFDTKIKNLGGLQPREIPGVSDFQTYVGGGISTFFLPLWGGVAQSDDANGRWKAGDELIYRAERDANGNLTGRATNELFRPRTLTELDSNRVLITDKPWQPRLYGGLNNTFKYKWFDLGILATFQWGNYVLDQGERLQSYVNGNNNLRADAVNAWSPTNPSTTNPRLFYNRPPVAVLTPTDQPSNRDIYYLDDPLRQVNTTRFLHDASFIRIKTISFGFTLDPKWIEKYKLTSCRFSINLQNWFTFTKFPGWDPEVSPNLATNEQRNLLQGRTTFDFPQVRTITFGLNIGF